MRFWCLILLTTLTLSAHPGLLSAAPLMGKASIDLAPVAGVMVSAYPATSLDFQAPPAQRSTATATDGLFALDLPPGEYYLLAEGAGLFSFYGRNPVSVPAEGLKDVNLLMTPADLPGPQRVSAVETGLIGRVTAQGQPVAGATVVVYPDLSSQLKGMGLAASLPTDETGFFELPLPAGRYYLVVRVRRGGALVGPLKAGDLFGYHAGNPLILKPEQVVSVQLPVIEVPDNVKRHAGSMFGGTRISGRIVDARGEPVPGLVAMLYEDSSMLNRPLYVSVRTGPDGRFVLTFPQGGTYFLAARNELGGTPAPGELYGRYQGPTGQGLTIDTGQTVAEIEIVVEDVF